MRPPYLSEASASRCRSPWWTMPVSATTCLVHVGYALNKISPDEADRTLRLLKQAGVSGEAGS